MLFALYQMMKNTSKRASILELKSFAPMSSIVGGLKKNSAFYKKTKGTRMSNTRLRLISTKLKQTNRIFAYNHQVSEKIRIN